MTGLMIHQWLKKYWSVEYLRNNKYLKWIQCVVIKKLSKYNSIVAFLKALVIHPKRTGAILPSSKRLAQKMVSYMKLSQDGIVVELGAGTGVITEAILKSGVSPKKIVVIECSAGFVKTLRKRFPEIQIIQGSAANLVDLLQNEQQRIDTIISSLPLRSLSEGVVQAVLSQIPAVLSSKGRYIQFTYDVRNSSDYYPDNYHLFQSKRIWQNIPPAKIEVFTFSQKNK